MGEAFLVRRGKTANKSVSTSDFAIICAKFPSGSTCTCTKGAKALTAMNAPGLAAFSVPESGNWTVEITDGTRTANTTVAVSEGDVKIVTLAYTPDELVILSTDDGLASGYSCAGGASIGETGYGYGPTNIVVSEAGYITPAIDVTNYDTLTITGKTTYSQLGASTIVFADPNGNSHYDENAYNFELSQNISEETTITFDVSQKTGTYYIGAVRSSNTFVFTSIVLS